MNEGHTKLESIQAAEKKLMLNTYERNPVLMVGGSGVFLRDEQGTDYLDLLSGIGVCALGYAHPAVEAAIAAQSKRLLHTSNLFFHEHTAELAVRLTEMSGLDRVFFCNSGTEAWETALKLARAHAGVLRAEGRTIGTDFLAMDQSFHGRTMGSVATTHKQKYREPFAPVMPGVEFVRFNDVADLRQKFSSQVCGICIEVIQGEAAFVRRAGSSLRRRAICAIPPARCCWPTRSNPAWAAPASGSPTSTTAFCRTSPPWPSRLPMACPWERCSARTKRRGLSRRGCTARPLAADRWFARWRLP